MNGDNHDAHNVGDIYDAPIDFGDTSLKPATAKAGTDASSSHSRRRSMRGPLARRLSSVEMDDSKSLCSSVGDFMMHDVDISKVSPMCISHLFWAIKLINSSKSLFQELWQWYCSNKGERISHCKFGRV